MLIKIYQINDEKDEARYPNCKMFEKYNESTFTFEDYDEVYACEMQESSLDEVYRIFNTAHPSLFTGHSLSVSDVVEVRNSSEINPGFYYCQPCGWLKIDF